MFGSDILDAAIGLFLVYFLFSVLCSTLNEWIVGHMRGMRAKTLEIGIERLLACSDTKNDFFNLPLIRSLAIKNEAKPSYISSATFVDGLLALVKAKATEVDPTLADITLDKASQELDPLRVVVSALKGVEMQPILESLLSGAKDMEEARKKLEAWFNEGMDRATGWYKKHAQIWTAVLALGVVGFFNLDTLTIMRELMSNSKLRATLVASAEETVKQPTEANNPSMASNTVAAIEQKIKELQLPIGWAWHTNVINAASTPPVTVASAI